MKYLIIFFFLFTSLYSEQIRTQCQNVKVEKNQVSLYRELFLNIIFLQDSIVSNKTFLNFINGNNYGLKFFIGQI
jgi:hypothetical protein